MLLASIAIAVISCTGGFEGTAQQLSERVHTYLAVHGVTLHTYLAVHVVTLHTYLAVHVVTLHTYLAVHVVTLQQEA